MHLGSKKLIAVNKHIISNFDVQKVTPIEALMLTLIMPSHIIKHLMLWTYDTDPINIVYLKKIIS